MKNTCSIKLLKNAYIGAGVRMSKGKDTVPFENKPMKGLLIERYTKQGFRISHENLPKTIWVDFDQLPLTRLKIENGVIEDEITFVENIVYHRMQLIRTLDTEYMDLLHAEKALEEKESGGDIIPISQAELGHVYIGAQCKENIPMIYLGTWYAKGVHRHHNYNYGWGSSSKADSFHLEKQSPERAFFLIDTQDLTGAEEKKLDAFKRPDGPDRGKDEDWNDYYNRKAVIDQTWSKERNKIKQNMLSDGPAERWKILAYPVSSKRVKKLIKTSQFSDKFTSEKYNKELIINSLCNEDGSFHGKRSEQDGLVELNKSYPRVEMDGFIIVSNRYGDPSYAYLTKDKNDINNRAYKFINKNFKCTLSSTEYMHARYLEKFETPLG